MAYGLLNLVVRGRHPDFLLTSPGSPHSGVPCTSSPNQLRYVPSPRGCSRSGALNAAPTRPGPRGEKKGGQGLTNASGPLPTVIRQTKNPHRFTYRVSRFELWPEADAKRIKALGTLYKALFFVPPSSPSPPLSLFHRAISSPRAHSPFLLLLLQVPLSDFYPPLLVRTTPPAITSSMPCSNRIAPRRTNKFGAAKPNLKCTLGVFGFHLSPVTN